MNKLLALSLISMSLASASPSPSITVRDLGVPVKAVNWVRLHPGRGRKSVPPNPVPTGSPWRKANAVP